jgi:acetyl esterase/lipase
MRTIRRAAAVITLLFGAAAGPAARGADAEVKTLRLWAGDAPLAQGQEQSTKATNDVPTVTVYPAPADKNTGAAIVICPGGGYGGLAAHEGTPVAEWANALGVTGVVLRYRLGPKYHHPAMQLDVNRAIRLVRHHAAEWGVDPKRVGVLGFSAGGHEASTAATHFDAGKPDGDDVDKQSCRPDVAVLIYPVITMTDPFTHKGSRNNLLGKPAATAKGASGKADTGAKGETGAKPDAPKDGGHDAALVELMSNEKQVTKDTPPTFLVHSSDDKVVPIENSFLFAQALAKNGVPFTFVSFKTGAHGFGMGKLPETISWPSQCAVWLEGQGFLKAKAAEAK